MATIPYPFLRCSKTTWQSDAAVVDLMPRLSPRVDLIIEKRTRWSTLLLAIGEDTTTDVVFEILWKRLGGPSRYLSVAKRDDTMWALLYKGDQQVVSNMASPVETAYDIKKPNGGGAARKAIADFADVWFCSQEVTSNFVLEGEADEEQHAAIEDVYKDMSAMADEELQFKVWPARQKKPTQRNPFDRAVLAGQAPLRAIKKADLKRTLENAVVFRVGENATELEYPRDIATLLKKRGRTYNEQTERYEERPITDYTESILHMEKVLVLWGKGGRGKTQAARCIAKHLAIGHGTGRYMSTDSADALKLVQHLFDELVPIVFEEFGAGDVSQQGRSLSAN